MDYPLHPFRHNTKAIALVMIRADNRSEDILRFCDTVEEMVEPYRMVEVV